MPISRKFFPEGGGGPKDIEFSRWEEGGGGSEASFGTFTLQSWIF